MQNEKRKFPRLLCSDQFSNSTIIIDDVAYEMISVNFNNSGMAVYSHIRLPETNICFVSFTLDNESPVEIMNIPATIRYRHEMETGNQYGLEFKIEEMEQPTIAKLKSIEEYLRQSEDLESRWPLP
ncbi:PilZ domain-containing protein [Pleionea sediminis]|uniref:PilZ domain-containing protein n=1 Tax=Pleionea sediminis TaxID=2569479 RepID=UPI001184999E|nr:PilZ domain-containing protein [Pleionea sediminis]